MGWYALDDLKSKRPTTVDKFHAYDVENLKTSAKLFHYLKLLLSWQWHNKLTWIVRVDWISKCINPRIVPLPAVSWRNLRAESNYFAIGTNPDLMTVRFAIPHVPAFRGRVIIESLLT